jgi:DNA-binding response OmpR family regulator
MRDVEGSAKQERQELCPLKRRILLVDDEVAVLLTLKAILEINGYVVDTAASARDAKLKLKKNQYAMVITDMRMENDAAGAEVIQAARNAEYHPALALLTAFPLAEEDWHEMETDKVEVLMKPMQTRELLEQIDSLLHKHEVKLEALLASLRNGRVAAETFSSEGLQAKKAAANRAPATKIPAKAEGQTAPSDKKSGPKSATKKSATKKVAAKKVSAKAKQAR